MPHPAIQALYQAIARKPYYTGRSCAAEFGPPPGAVLDRALKQYSTVELLRGDRKAMIEKIVRGSRLSSSMKKDLRTALTLEFNHRVKKASATERKKAGVR